MIYLYKNAIAGDKIKVKTNGIFRSNSSHRHNKGLAEWYDSFEMLFYISVASNSNCMHCKLLKRIIRSCIVRSQSSEWMTGHCLISQIFLTRSSSLQSHWFFQHTDHFYLNASPKKGYILHNGTNFMAAFPHSSFAFDCGTMPFRSCWGTNRKFNFNTHEWR